MFKKLKLGSLLAMVVVSLGAFGIVKATTAEPTNVATKGWAQVDVSKDITYNADANGAVERINDGSIDANTGRYRYGNYKSSNMDEYVYLTLNDTYNVSTIKVDFTDKGRIPEKYSMSIWNGTTWEDVGESTPDPDKARIRVWSFTNNEKKCTAIRLHITQCNIKQLFINEIEVWGVASNKKITTPQVLINTENRALNAAVEMNVPSWATNYPATKLVDGTVLTHNNFATGGNGNETDEDTITLTLQEASLIDSVVLYPAIQNNKYIGGFPEDFTISVYNGKDWVEVKKVSGQSVGEFGADVSSLYIKSYKFDPIDATGVRIVVAKRTMIDQADSGKYAVRLGEIKVNGVQSSDKDILKPGEVNPGQQKPEDPKKPITGSNMALNATVEMNVPDWAVNRGLSSDNLVDGAVLVNKNFVTTATVQQTVQEAVTLVLQQSSKIHSVLLYPAVQSGKYIGGFPSDFKVEGYNGTEWVELTTQTNQNVGEIGTEIANLEIDNYLFDAVEVSAVRITITKHSEIDSVNSGQYALRLGEIKVMGEATTNIILTPDGAVPEAQQPAKPKNPITGTNVALNATVEMNVPGWATNGGLGAGNLVDGAVLVDKNFATTASTTQTEKDTITFVLETASKVHSVILYPAIQSGKYIGGFPVDFKVEGYNGTKWVELTTQTDQDMGTIGTTITDLDIANYLFDAVEVSAVRVTTTVRSEVDNNGSGKYAVRLGEVQVMGSKSSKTILKPGEVPEEPLKGTNVALNADVEMTVPSWATKYPATKLVDDEVLTHNNFATGDTIKENTKDTITLALKEASRIDNVLLYPAVQNGKYIGGYPVDFTISIYDGNKWVEVKKVSKQSVGTIGTNMSEFKATRYSFGAVDATGVRITVTKHSEVDKVGSGKYAIRLGEIQVMGEKSTKTDMKKPVIATAGTNGNGTGGSNGTGLYPNKVTEIDNANNLALYRPTKASSHLGDYGAPTEKASDGNINSYWCSDNRTYEKGKSEWIEVNLLNNFAVNRVVLGARTMAYGFPIDFKVEVFYDGEWKVAHTVKGFEADEKAPYTAYEFTFPAVIGNKVRISSDNFRKIAELNSMCITELAVYGKSVSGNYVLPNENMLTSGTAVTATTSMEDYDYYLIHLTDNSLVSGWSSVPTIENEPQTIEFDMKGEIQLSEIQIKPAWGGHGFPIDFVISVYEDGKWVDVYEAKDYDKPEDEAIQRFQFETKKTTKFRITATKLAREAGMYAIKLNEVMAFPNHTGDEFEADAVKSVESYVKPADSEVLSPSDEDTNNTAAAIQTGKLIAGAVIMVISIGGCILTLLLSRKKNKNK